MHFSLFGVPFEWEVDGGNETEVLPADNDGDVNGSEASCRVNDVIGLSGGARCKLTE